MIAREKDIPYGSKGYPFLGPPLPSGNSFSDLC